MTIMEIVVSVFLLVGTAIMLLSSLGIVRFGDVFLRMHAATKSGTLGIGFIMIAVALFFGESIINIKLLALTVLYFFTSPIGAQVLAHAAHLSNAPMVKETWVDDLATQQHTRETESQTE